MVDVSERRRQVISAIAGTEFSKSLRVGDRKFLVRAESLDRIANLLRLRHPHRRRSNLCDDADNAVVARATVDGVHHIAQRSLFGEHQARRRRVRDILDESLLEVVFENCLRGYAPLLAYHSYHYDYRPD